ncbi:MBOA2 acyltransferase, partial [Pygoscelis papua]
QINFVACQLFALLAAFWFRIYLGPSHASSAVRHAFATLFGIYFAVFCFGWYSIHLFVLVMMNYGIMNMASIPNIHRYSFVVAMGYLTLCHISRIYIFHYGILTTDFSGPLMIITQKITTLACQLHDGIGRQAEELTAEQNRLAVNKRPTGLLYYYVPGFLVSCFWQRNAKWYLPPLEQGGANPGVPLLWGDSYVQLQSLRLGRVLWANFRQGGCLGFFGCVFVLFCFVLNRERIKNLETFLLRSVKSSSFSKVENKMESFMLEKVAHLFIYLLLVLLLLIRFSPWFSDAVNNAAGYGFSGVDERGAFRWDLLSNLNIWNIETATSFKMYIENWNIQTAAWLKRVCYDRAPWYPTALTFILSALWHGIYPGYYFTFLTGILITLAARAIRNNCRHYFLSSVPLKIAYDIVTWVATQLAVCYTVAPFVMLAVEPTIKFYK